MFCVSRAGGGFAIGVLAVASLHLAGHAATVLPDTIPVVSGPLTLERAVELAGRYEQGLRAAGLRAEAALARIGDAGRRPNPTLIASKENFAGALGGDHRETSLTVAQPVEIGGDRGARRAAAEAEYQVSIFAAAVLAHDVRAVTVDRYIDAWSLQSRLTRLEAGERTTRQAIQAATSRHEAGATPRSEILRAESQAITQAVERRRTESLLAVARRELALSWGTVEATFDTLVIPEFTDPERSVGSGTLPASSPELSRATASEALAAARLRAASAARVPDLTLSGGIRRLEEVQGTGFLVAIEMPLPIWSGNRGGVIAARRELEASAAERRATEQQLRVALTTAMERVRSAAAALDTLRLQVIPAREQLVEELLHGYRSGRSSYLDLAAEQRNLLDAELALVDAQADLWRSSAHFALLTGTGLFETKEER